MDYAKDFYESYAETSYGRIFYRHNNASGKNIVFLHGVGADSRVWKRLVEYLPESMHVFALDLLGHGNSDKPRVNYTVEMQAKALSEFISANCGKAVIFGHSYGGWIAAYYAYMGFSAEGIILEDAAGLKSYFDEIANSGNYEVYKEKLLKNLLMQNNNDEYAMKSIVQNESANALTDSVLSYIKIPTLIIWGTSDSIVDKKFAYRFNESISGSKLIMVEGAGHDAHYTNPKEVAEAIEHFVGELA
ncbi:MAG: alpha/beta hydrolase [Candidatus Micrarchaeaceae archaeon]